MADDAAPPERESMDFDVVIVGAGPAGLAAAIRMRQLAAEHGREISVVVLEKGSEVGAHILSGAVIDPIGLDRLLPDWKDTGRADLAGGDARTGSSCWARAAICASRISSCRRLMSNHGNYIISLGDLCRWLGEQAEAIWVSEIYPGFSGAGHSARCRGAVAGVATGDMGVGRDGKPQGPVYARHGAARQIYAVRGRRARLADQAARADVRTARGPRAAEIRSRPQGAVAGQAGEAQARPRPAHARLAARRCHRRRLVHVSLSARTWWRSASSCI